MWIDLSAAVVSWAIVGQHIWATRGHFVSERMAPGALLLGILVIVTTLVYSVLLFLTDQPLAAVVAGIILELASLALFWSAIVASRQARLRFAFDPDPPHGLINRGPYRVLRHPFYTSYLLFWIGWAVATWSIWALPLLVCMGVFYTVAARGEERKFAGSDLGADYERYRQATGLFWPKPWAKR